MGTTSCQCSGDLDVEQQSQTTPGLEPTTLAKITYDSCTCYWKVSCSWTKSSDPRCSFLCVLHMSVDKYIHPVCVCIYTHTWETRIRSERSSLMCYESRLMQVGDLRLPILDPTTPERSTWPFDWGGPDRDPSSCQDRFVGIRKPYPNRFALATYTSILPCAIPKPVIPDWSQAANYECVILDDDYSSVLGVYLSNVLFPTLHTKRACW